MLFGPSRLHPTKECLLPNVVPALCFLFWVSHSLCIKNKKLSALPEDVASFEDYWNGLRREHTKGGPTFANLIPQIVNHVGVTQLLPPSPRKAAQ